MPLFCLDRSPNLAALPRSPQRAARFAGIAGAGGMLALVGVMVSGGGADGASNAGADTASTTVATGTAAAPLPLTPLATTAVTDAVTTTTLAPLVCTNSYTVVAGDFWVRIAQEASISTNDLLTANRATTDTPLYPDQVICLPDGVSVVVPTTVATPATTKATTPATTATTVKPRPAPVTTTPNTTSHSSG